MLGTIAHVMTMLIGLAALGIGGYGIASDIRKKEIFSRFDEFLLAVAIVVGGLALIVTAGTAMRWW